MPKFCRRDFRGRLASAPSAGEVGKLKAGGLDVDAALGAKSARRTLLACAPRPFS